MMKTALALVPTNYKVNDVKLMEYCKNEFNKITKNTVFNNYHCAGSVVSATHCNEDCIKMRIPFGVVLYLFILNYMGVTYSLFFDNSDLSFYYIQCAFPRKMATTISIFEGFMSWVYNDKLEKYQHKFTISNICMYKKKPFMNNCPLGHVRILDKLFSIDNDELSKSPDWDTCAYKFAREGKVVPLLDTTLLVFSAPRTTNSLPIFGAKNIESIPLFFSPYIGTMVVNYRNKTYSYINLPGVSYLENCSLLIRKGIPNTVYIKYEILVLDDQGVSLMDSRVMRKPVVFLPNLMVSNFLDHIIKENTARLVVICKLCKIEMDDFLILTIFDISSNISI
jgi:hypothetical protein